MRKILVLLGLGLVALTGCKKDSTPSLVENPILPPSTETFAPGATVTIKGSGFTDADEIWFRAQTKATDDIQATITKQTATEITFIVPQGLPAGEQTVLLKRDDQEMPLGKITVAEATTSTKLYAIGSTDDSDTEVLWEIDKATGELTEIVKLPIEVSESVEEWWGDYPVVNPADGNIYLYKWFETTNVSDLYRINPTNKTLEKIGQLQDGNEDAHYYLCMVDNQLHALIEKETTDDEETFYSFVSIDPNTAAQTPVADFGSLHQALNIPLSVSAGLDGEGKFYYDIATKSLIVPIFKDVEGDCWQLTRFDIVNQKIIPGVGSSDNYISLFVKDSKACGAFYNDDINTVDFRVIDTEKLTAGESLGSTSTGNEDKFFGETWIYDTATGKGYATMYFEDSSDEYSLFGAFDFNTKEFKEIKQYANGIELWTIFN